MRARLLGFYSKSKFKSGGLFYIRHGEKSGTIRVGQLYQIDGCAVLCFVPTLASIGDMRYFTVRWVPVCLMDPPGFQNRTRWGRVWFRVFKFWLVNLLEEGDSFCHLTYNQTSLRNLFFGQKSFKVFTPLLSWKNYSTPFFISSTTSVA